MFWLKRLFFKTGIVGVNKLKENNEIGRNCGTVKNAGMQKFIGQKLVNPPNGFRFLKQFKLLKLKNSNAKIIFP